ncbi:MAG: CBS domain-containing protein [Candidatus Micrarchaeia archaeon]
MLPELAEIKRKRRRLGLRQTELAKLAGVSQSLIAKLEAGKVDPSYGKAKAIFDALEKIEEKEWLMAKDIMTRKVISVSKGDRVEDAVRMMKKLNISQLPVLDGNNAVGMISEAVITEKVGEGADLSALSKARVADVMADPPPRVGEETPLPVLSALLRHAPAVLIVKKERIVGIVTKADLLKAVHR